MKSLLKQFRRSILRSTANRIAAKTRFFFDRESTDQQLQLSIKNQWVEWRSAGKSHYNNIREAGFRCYSQHEEDGIILYLLTMLGVHAGTVVEMCCGVGSECMAANLILNHGFKGYLFDGSEENIKIATQFFRSKFDCHLVMPELKSSWITRENVNDLLRGIGCPKEVDLFSLDIDGNDYWVWEAIDAIRPKVCCLETSDIIPSDRSLTVPYNPTFDCWSQPPERQDFRSASLAATVKLGRKKGYRLVGAHRHGFNAFFVRNDLCGSLFPEVGIAEIHDNPWTRFGQATRWPVVKDLEWVEV